MRWSGNMRLIIGFFGALLLQVAVMKNFILFDRAFTFYYVIFVLSLPFEMGPIALIFLAFLSGLGIDIFYDSLGLHASASVVVAFLRPWWVNLITPRGGYDQGSEPKLKIMGFEWYLSYALPLIFFHHFVLFYLELGGFHLFWYTLVRVVLSSLLSFTVIVLLSFLFSPSTSRRTI